MVAYNKDIEGFAAVADTVQRLLMCNVVVCNTGFFGGSLAFSPFRERYKRYSFNIKGNNIGAAVSVKLPLKVLAQHQKDQLVRLSDEEKPLFIHKPPAFGLLGSMIGTK
ncbi:hypothetical protein SDC9_168428 [bioreactor metagenome]|uniref:Uncharacterized protein n=1 Tax=bioreactor metagenome TaxID=1076179 RepID=A0A645G5H2_9ZZZZ